MNFTQPAHGVLGFQGRLWRSGRGRCVCRKYELMVLNCFFELVVVYGSLVWQICVITAASVKRLTVLFLYRFIVSILLMIMVFLLVTSTLDKPLWPYREHRLKFAAWEWVVLTRRRKIRHKKDAAYTHASLILLTMYMCAQYFQVSFRELLTFTTTSHTENPWKSSSF